MPRQEGLHNHLMSLRIIILSFGQMLANLTKLTFRLPQSIFRLPHSNLRISHLTVGLTKLIFNRMDEWLHLLNHIISYSSYVFIRHP